MTGALGENDMKLDRLYVAAAFAWLVFGMCYGIYLGSTEQLNLANSHAHANLVGFVISLLFGLLHRGWPALQEHRIARMQFWAYEAGAVLLVLGKFFIDQGQGNALAALVVPGSVLLLIGTVAMAWMFFANKGE